MKNCLIILFSFFWSINTFAQKSINGKHFTLNCNCSVEEDVYNNINKSYKYSIVDDAIGCLYLISTKEVPPSTDKKYMLDLFYKETPGYNFATTTFKGYASIKGKGTETINGSKFKTYLFNFFTEKVFYTITIFAFSDDDLENAYRTFAQKIILK